MKFTSIFLFLIILYSGLAAQVKLTGTVNNTLKLPIPYTGITLKSLSGEQDKTVQADSMGHFILKNISAGKYMLTASIIGYHPVQVNITLSSDTILNIILPFDEKQLKEVVVNASKPTIENGVEKLIYNVSSSITANGDDALTAISKVPGIKVNNNEINIAGKGAVRVMVNDRLIQLAGEDLTRFLKSISANQISKIELIKNPSAAYDAEGNAGLINITTKQSNKQGLSGNVQISEKQWLNNPSIVYGTSNYWMANSSLNLNYNSSKWLAYANLNVDQDHELEGFETDVFYPKQTWLQTDTGNYRYHNYNGIVGVEYKLSHKATIGLSYMGGSSTYDGSDHVNNPIYNQNRLDSTLRTYATYHPVALSNSVNLHTIIHFDTTGKKLLINADYFNYYRIDHSNFESNTFLPDGTAIPLAETQYYDTNKQNINVYTFKADAEIPTRFAKLAFGSKLSFINNYSNAFYFNKSQAVLVYNTNLSNEFNYRENTQAVYANINGEKNKWKYQAGLRGELTQTKGYSYTLQQTTVNNYLRLFPSILVSYQADTANSFSFTFGRRINRPTFWNLNPFKSLFTAYSYGEGNPYLQPEYNSNIELSHIYKNSLTSSLFLNITNNGFYNVTIAKTDTNLVYTIPLNFIKTYRFGISESLSLHPFPWLDNSEQVTAYHTNAYSSLSYISNIQSFGLYLATNNTIYLKADKSLAAAVNFWYQFPETDHIGMAAAYYKLDLGLTALAFKKKVNITLNLNDAFMSSASSVTTTVNGIREKFTNFQINKFVQLSISYRFGNPEQGSKKQVTGNEDERGRTH